MRENLEIKDYANVLHRRKNTALLFFTTVVLVVTLGSFIIRPVYRANTTLLIDLENPNVLTASGMVEIQSQNYYSYKEYYQSQIEILTSIPIAQKVFDEFNLITKREYRSAKEPVKKFLKTVKVQPIRDTRLLELYVDNNDPSLAAKIANRIAEIYVKRNLYYISKNELLNLLKNEYLKLETKLSEYSKIYKEGHPEMIRLKEEINEVVDKIEKEKKSVFRQDYKEEEELLNNYKYALEGLKANNVSILTPAKVPVIPLKPKKLLNMVLAVLIGGIGGVALAFFFEYIDDTIKDIGDLDSLAKWHFLGSIPKIDGDGKMGEFEKDMFVHVKSKDPIAEAYRSIRTSLIFSSTEENPLRSIVITSPGPQEGKTITLCNLGIAMAQSGKKVLLVDADMRKPRLHSVFKKENKLGLSGFLSKNAEFDKVVQETKVENLYLINGGPHPVNPSELIAGQRMKELITSAREKFDYILFDTPPIVVVTDAAILAREADSVIMVIEAEKTSKRIIPRISQILENAKAKAVNVLLNKISIRTSDYYYYYSHYYSK